MPTDRVPQCHISTAQDHLRGWRVPLCPAPLHHLSLREEIVPNIQPEGGLSLSWSPVSAVPKECSLSWGEEKMCQRSLVSSWDLEEWLLSSELGRFSTAGKRKFAEIHLCHLLRRLLPVLIASKVRGVTPMDTGAPMSSAQCLMIPGDSAKFGLYIPQVPASFCPSCLSQPNRSNETRFSESPD